MKHHQLCSGWIQTKHFQLVKYAVMFLSLPWYVCFVLHLKQVTCILSHDLFMIVFISRSFVMEAYLCFLSNPIYFTYSSRDRLLKMFL